MELGFQKIKTSLLSKAEWNYKLDNTFLSNQLASNIKENGQIESIVVREIKGGFEIVNGNHRLDAFKANEFKDVQCYNLGKIDVIKAKRIAIELNETRFESDETILGNIISDLVENFTLPVLAKTLPYVEQEIAALAEQGDFDWDEIDKLTRGEKNQNNKIETQSLSLTLTGDALEQWKKAKASSGQEEELAAFITICNTYNREN
tara:strand:+ start:435 stop:1049 length:615 start_codon:yes stop_codon:yes gene_type:complete